MLRLLTVALLGLAFVVGSAVAAALPTSSLSLGSGTANLVPCDGDGVALGYQLDSAEQLTSVTMRNVSTNCAGGTARVTLTNVSAVIGSGTANIPTSGFSGEVVVMLGSTVDPADVQITAVAIDGA